MHYLAQDVNIGGEKINSPIKFYGGQPATVGGLLNTVIPFVIMICSILLFFVFVWGGYDFMMSRGDPGKVKAARAKITYGIIGFVVLILSFFIVKLIAQIFGLGKGFLGG